VIETLIAAFGSLVALGALVVSFMAHPHQVARAAALDVREGRIEAREVALEQREQRVQASMIEVHVRASRSALHDGWVTPRLTIVNPSNQPVTDLAASYLGETLPDVCGPVGPGTTRSFPLPPNDARAEPVLHHVTLAFTDAAGTRWRRDGGGGLHRGVPRPDGQWEWTAREEPVIGESLAHVYPAANERPADFGDARPDPLGLPKRRSPRPVRVGVAAVIVLVVVLTVVILRR
jgi:hypothetical protein